MLHPATIQVMSQRGNWLLLSEGILQKLQDNSSSQWRDSDRQAELTYSWEAILRSRLSLTLFQVVCPVKVCTLVSFKWFLKKNIRDGQEKLVKPGTFAILGFIFF